MKNLLAGLALATTLVACSDRTPHVIAVPQTAPAEAARPGVLTVSGLATLDVSPDCADMTMTLTSDGARPGIAAATLATKQQAVIAAMTDLGLATSDLKISHITLDPIYRDWPRIKVATYRAQITITATTKKFALVASMMEAGANAGATSLSTQFRRSDLPELKKQVRAMALKAAKEKAQLTASTLGIELGAVTTVAETPAGHMWRSLYFPNYIGNVGGAAPAPAATTGEATLGGTLQTLSLEVTVGFALATSA